MSDDRDGEACTSSCGFCGRCSPGYGYVRMECRVCHNDIWIHASELPVFRPMHDACVANVVNREARKSAEVRS